MACYRPLECWRSRDVNDNGKRPVTFQLHSGIAEDALSVPCGKCAGCVKDAATAWSVRCYHEASLSDRNCFVTLTYAEDRCPGSLVKSDVQKWLKRVRSEGVKLRYFACGEYGGQTRRPHYHVLVFGQDFLEGSQKLGYDNKYYTSPFLDDSWGNGFVTVAPVDAGACFYVAGYSLKNIGCDDSFHLASRRPPIGDGWLDKYYDNVARLGFITIEGKRVPLPKAYLSRERFGVEFDHIKENRKEYFRTLSPDDVWRNREVARPREKNLIARTGVKRSTI